MINHIILLAVLATPSSATDEAKPPWLWTFEERVAKRVDPVAREGRRARELPNAPRVAAGRSPIIGAKEPELFMPYELLRILIRSTAPQSAQGPNARRGYHSAIQRAGWDYDEFWTILDSASASYLALMLQSAGAQRTSHGKADLSELGLLICAAQADALRQLYDSFGETAFNEFLYTSVAPAAFVWIDDQAETVFRLRQTARGCK